MNEVATIVVTYNRKKMLVECLEALINSTYKSDIYIIDNCSTDGTYDDIKKYIGENVYYENTGENLGGAGGFNYGIKVALKSNYKYIWLMDDDTIVKENSLEILVKKAKILLDKFSFLSSIALWKDGSLCKMNVQGISSEAIHSYNTLKNGLLKIDYASFVSCFINVDIIKQIGLPIKEFFIYGDDMEYTIRLNCKCPGYLVPESEVVHKMVSNAGINIIDIDKSRIDRYYYNYRNLLYLYKKYNKKEFKIFKLKCYYLILKILFKSKNYKFKRIKVIIKALLSYKKFNPTIEFIKE